jgi:hypothetical protein
MMNEHQFGATHAKLATDGGFTVDPRTGEDATSGLSVAPRGNERKVPIGESSPATLESYAADNTDRWSGGRNASLGGWRSEDADYYDTPTVYKNTPGGHVGARKQMILAGQEAGFHLDTFQEVFNPFHPEGRRKSGRESHELADIAGRGREGSEFVASQPEAQAWINSPREGGAASRSGLRQGRRKSG